MSHVYHEKACYMQKYTSRLADLRLGFGSMHGALNLHHKSGISTGFLAMLLK